MKTSSIASHGVSDERPSTGWRGALALRLRVLLYLTVALSLVGFVGSSWLPIELTTHFRPHYFVLLAAGALWLFVLRRWKALVPVMAAAVLQGALLLPWFVSSATGSAQSNGTPLRLMLANVHTANREHGLVLDQIAHEDPDIVILLETNERWKAALESLKESYPHHGMVARNDNFGIALYSRLPLDDLFVEHYGSAEVPTMVATLQVGGQPLTLIATHPVPPVDSEYFTWRNEQLQVVARFAAQQARTIVIGDLNVTMWSPYLAEFERSSGLRNVRRGRGILPSWPVSLGLFMIPLDHCFASTDIAVHDVRLGQPTGSDHLPLIVDLLLP